MKREVMGEGGWWSFAENRRDEIETGWDYRQRITGTARITRSLFLSLYFSEINRNARSAANYGKPTREETEKRIESRSPRERRVCQRLATYQTGPSIFVTRQLVVARHIFYDNWLRSGVKTMLANGGNLCFFPPPPFASQLTGYDWKNSRDFRARRCSLSSKARSSSATSGSLEPGESNASVD